MSLEAGGPANISVRKRDHLNHQHDNRKRDFSGGEAANSYGISTYILIINA
jgi:hypothetical protein